MKDIVASGYCFLFHVECPQRDAEGTNNYNMEHRLVDFLQTYQYFKVPYNGLRRSNRM